MAPLTALTLIVVLGIAAQLVAWRIGVPSILVLLIVGVGAGQWLDPDQLFGELLFPAVSLAVAVIMYEGGLTLKMRELPTVGSVVRNLVTIGAGVTWLMTAAVAHWVLELDLPIAALLAGILVVTGPTVIAPLLRHIRPSGVVGPILKWEGIVIDPIGALLAVLIYEVVAGAGHGGVASHFMIGLGKTVLFGGGLGAIAAWLMTLLIARHWIPDHLESTVSLMLVIAAFTASNALQHESGLLAVTIMGFILANQRRADIRHIVEFKENLRVLLISTLFIVLAARLDFASLTAVAGPGALFIAAIVLVIRPCSVLVSTMGAGMAMRERLFISWMAPRGIVAAAVSSIFALRLEADGHPQAAALVTFTFLTIIATVAIYALTAPLLARRLGVAESNPQGLLFVGAHPWVRAVAVVLQREGFGVLLVDSNRDNVQAARMAGLKAQAESILAESAIDELDLGGLGRLAAVTSNDWVNILAVQRFRPLFGKAACYQVQPSTPAQTDARHGYLRGRTLFGDGATLAALERADRAGWKARATRLSEEFDYDAFLAHYGNDAITLMIIDSGRLEIITADSRPPQVGQTLISMAKGEDAVA